MLDVRALEHKEVRSLLMMLLVNQKSLLDALRLHMETEHASECAKSETMARLRRLDSRLERFLDELSHISSLLGAEDSKEG